MNERIPPPEWSEGGELGFEDLEEERGRLRRPRRPVLARPLPRPQRFPWPRFRPRPRLPWGPPFVAVERDRPDREPSSPTEPADSAAAPAPTAPADSELVRWVQSSLNLIMGLRLPVDGVMGPDTRSALRSFQERAGLPADGIVGPDTERALADARARQPRETPGAPAAESEVSDVNVRPVDRRTPEYVRWLQEALNRVVGARLTVDGRSGPATRAAIRTFQQRHGLTADGVVGPQTERALVAAGAPPPPAAAAPVTPNPASATSFLVRGVPLPAAPALSVINFADPRVVRLLGDRRPGRQVTELVVHETETWSAPDTVAVLQKRGLGVHLILGPDGQITQHGDLGDDVTWHAGNHNGRSVGVEVVNPIFERNLGLYRRLYPRRPALPWTRTIAAGWLDGGSYVLPTPIQAEALARLVAWITSPAALGLEIPRRWIGISDRRLAMRTVAGAQQPAPGIYAHSHIAPPKQDGPWLVLYAWLRLEAAMEAGDAYEEAARVAATRGTSAVLPESRPTSSGPV